MRSLPYALIDLSSLSSHPFSHSFDNIVNFKFNFLYINPTTVVLDFLCTSLHSDLPFSHLELLPCVLLFSSGSFSPLSPPPSSLNLFNVSTVGSLKEVPHPTSSSVLRGTTYPRLFMEVITGLMRHSRTHSFLFQFRLRFQLSY